MTMQKSDFTIEERLEFLKSYVKLVAEKKSNSLIVSGQSGLGKSWRIMDIIKTYIDLKYFLVKGFATPRALYDTLYLNRNNLIIFDDCDSILEDKIAINLLKGALDSYDERVVSWLSKSNDKTIPLQFDFQGQVIFISNLPLQKFDKAMKSRALTIDVFMTTEEKIEQMYKVAKSSKFLPNYQSWLKEAIVTELLPYMDNENINFRTLEKAIKLYDMSNNTKVIQYIGETA